MCSDRRLGLQPDARRRWWRRAILAALLLCLPFCRAEAAETAPLPARSLFMGYYESWSEWPVATPAATRLAGLPGYLDIVAIGFARPDFVYDGGEDLAPTGLQVPFGRTMLAGAVALLKARHPGLKVVLAVGGASYAAGWPSFAPEAVGRLVKALGLDGIDLDYEPALPGCGPRLVAGLPTVACASDRHWTRYIRQIRAVLPRPALLTIPSWSVAAYGQQAFRDDPPASPFTGSMLWLAREPEAQEIDLISIMAYSAGPNFDPARAFAAHRAVWPGPLLLGVMVPPDPTGGPDYSLTDLKRSAQDMAKAPQAGIMLYTLERTPADGPSPASPDAAMAAKAICEGLGRDGCDSVLP